MGGSMIPSPRRIAVVVALMSGCCWPLESMAQQAPGQAAPSQKSAAQKAADGNAAEKKAPAKPKAAPKGEASKKLDPSAAQSAVEDGVNALGQGRTDAAVSSLTSALSASSLPQAQTARALYYRGVAYRRQNKPALAISDLTNALWVKGGLTEEQRADALQQRSAAFREAGLPDQGDPGAARATGKAGSASAPFAAVAPPAPAGSSTQVSGSGLGFLGNIFGGGSSAQNAPAATSTASVAPATTASVTPRVAPAVPPAASSSGQVVSADKPATRTVPVVNTGSGLPMGFQDMGLPTREVEVSTTARAAQKSAASAPVAAATPEPSRGKQVAAARTTPPDGDARKGAQSVQVASAPQSAVASTPPKSAAGGAASAARTGNLRVQVAAVRTAAEAQTVTSKLQSEFGRELAGRSPVVDQVSAGNFGSFYRVQVGPYASSKETEELCGKLKAGGLDCRIVGQ